MAFDFDFDLSGSAVADAEEAANLEPAPVDTEEEDKKKKAFDFDLAMSSPDEFASLVDPAPEPKETDEEKILRLEKMYADPANAEGFAKVSKSVGGTGIQQYDPSLAEEFTTGLTRGGYQLKGMGAGMFGLAADAMGVKGGADWGYDKYREAMEEAAKNEATISDPFTDIDNFSDAGRYAIGLLGEQIPQLLASIAGGGVGGAVGKSLAKKIIANEVLKRVAGGAAAGVAEREVAEAVTKSILTRAAGAKAAEGAEKVGLGAALDAAMASPAQIGAGAVARTAAQQAVKTGTRAGAISGAYTANFGQIAGGSYGQIRDETGVSGPDAVLAAAGQAVPGAFLDTLSEVFLASRFMKPFNKAAGKALSGSSLPVRLGAGLAKNAVEGRPKGSDVRMKINLY